MSQSNVFPTVDHLLALAAPVDEAGAKDRTRHSKLLENVISGGFDEVAGKLMRGAAEFAADGIFDEGEFYRFVAIGNEAISRIRKSIEMARCFVMQGEVIARKDGMVALCYDFGKCTSRTVEQCETCHRGAARFVPETFHDACVAGQPTQGDLAASSIKSHREA